MVILILILFTSVLSVSSAADQLNEAPTTLVDHSGLLAQLNSTDYHLREQAAQQLWSLGRNALPLLRDAASSSEPERSKRAEVLIELINMGVTVSTSQSTLGDIKNYSAADSQQVKLQALRGLISRGAAMQALYLLHNDSNSVHREFLSQHSEIRGVALTSAQLAMSENDVDLAITLMQLAPRANYNLRAHAHLLKYSGRLEQELAKVRKQPATEESQQWLLYLLQANGDLDTLQIFAENTENSLTLQILAALAGDPTPILDSFISASENPSFTEALIALKIPNAEDRSSVVEKIIQELRNTDDDPDEKVVESQLRNGIRISMLLGEKSLGESLIELADSDLSAAYYARMNQRDLELKALEIPDAQKEPQRFNKWLKKEIELEADPQSEIASDQASKLLYIAEFFHDLGEVELAEDIVNPLLNKLPQLRKARRVFLISEIKRIGMAHIQIQRAFDNGDKNGEFLEFTQAMFGDSDAVDRLWEVLQQHYPRSTRKQHFSQFMSLMGYCLGDEKPSKQIEKSLYGAPKSDTERGDMLDLLSFAAESRSDYMSMLKLTKELCALVDQPREEDVFKYRQAAELQMNWKEIILSYDLIEGFTRKSPISLARYAIALRKTGETKLGDQLLNQAIAQTLAMSEYSNYIGLILHSAGYEREAAELWMSVMVTSLDLGRGFTSAVYYLNNTSRYHIRSKQWRVAHSLALIEAAHLLDPYPAAIHPKFYLQKCFNWQFTQAMVLLENAQVEAALELLERAHSMLPSDGLLADYFFPALLDYKELESGSKRWLDRSWGILKKEIASYPQSHNSRNTLAWLGAKSLQRLDEALMHAKVALQLKPRQPAYLDTLAEVYFAKAERPMAVKTSNAALRAIVDGSQPGAPTEESIEMFWQLSQQGRRFINDPLPKLRN